jgi:hypothetical protein
VAEVIENKEYSKYLTATCAGVDGDSRYDARRMVGLLIAGLRQPSP